MISPETVARRRYAAQIVLRTVGLLLCVWGACGLVWFAAAALRAMGRGVPAAALLHDLPEILQNVVAPIAAVAGIRLGERRLVRWLVPDPPRGCPTCGYSLKDLRTPICPECGTALSRPAGRAG